MRPNKTTPNVDRNMLPNETNYFADIVGLISSSQVNESDDADFVFTHKKTDVERTRRM